MLNYRLFIETMFKFIIFVLLFTCLLASVLIYHCVISHSSCHSTTCVVSGVPVSVPGIMGCLQALEVIKIAIGIECIRLPFNQSARLIGSFHSGSTHLDFPPSLVP